jgi:hypothetical protein
MKKITAFTFFAFLLFAFSANAQIVTGKLIDEQQHPIEYASVQLGSDYIVVTNTEGIFVVDLSKKGTADKVIFSSIGFKTIAVAVDDFKAGTYVMPIQINELDELVVSSKKLSPQEILTEVIKNAPQNYSSKPVKQTFFLRTSGDNTMINSETKFVKSSLETRSTLRELNKAVDEVTKNSANKRSKDYLESYGYLYQQGESSKLVVEKVVELKNREKDVSGGQTARVIEVMKKHLEPDATYKLTSGWFTVDKDWKPNDSSKDKKGDVKPASLKEDVTNLTDALNKFYVNDEFDFLTEFKRYTYTLEGYAPTEDATIYIIDFKPLKSSADYYGKIYVNAEDFAIVKLQYNLKDGEKAKSVNLKLLLGIKMIQDRLKVNATFAKDKSGQYALNFVKEQKNTYMYIDRPLKFTKNKKDKKEEEKMLKFDVLAEVDRLVINELFIIDNEPISSQDFSNVKATEKYDINYISTYNPSIWKDYNVIAPVEAIKNYN